MSGLSDFYKVLKEVQKLSTWVLPTAGIAPILVSIAGLSPPWPDRAGLAICTSLVVLISLIFVFQMLRRKSRRRINTVLYVCLALLVFSGLSYFPMFSLLVYKTPVTGDSFVQGFECTNAATRIYPGKCPWLDIYDMKKAAYEASLLWTAPSIAAARLLLLSLWIILFGATSVMLGAFVSHQSETMPYVRKGRPKPIN